MTIMNGYATLEEFIAWGSITDTSAGDDAVVEDAIEGASRYIDQSTGRTFYSRSETRYYDVPPGRELRVDDDLLSITTLTNGDDNAIAATEYNFIPKNTTPYYALKLKQSSSTFWQFDSDGNSEGVISIAGGFGYSDEAPHDIREACLMIALASYHRRTGQNLSTVATVTAAGVVITPQDVPGTAARTLSFYRRRL